jgi:hypothetical protein
MLKEGNGVRDSRRVIDSVDRIIPAVCNGKILTDFTAQDILTPPTSYQTVMLDPSGSAVED